MNDTLPVVGTRPIVLDFKPVLRKLDEVDFFEFCQANRDWRIERTQGGEVIIMPPTGGMTGGRNFNLIGVFYAWVKANGTGKGFDSSTGFTLPNGARRSPDLAWIPLVRWHTLTPAEREEFPPLCPDFVVELRPRIDQLSNLQDKMQEYIDNGTQLGWLIDPFEKKVYIYSPSASVVCLNNPSRVSGEPVLPGFVLEMRDIWE